MRLDVARWACAVAFVCGVSPAAAKSYRAETYDSVIEILDGGDLRVTETVRFRFTRGSFTHVYRSLPLRGVDDIQIESSPDAYKVERSGRRVQVDWNFPALHDTARTFVLTYRVRGAWGAGDGRRQLDWRTFPDERSYTIEHATATLSWPASWGEPIMVSARPGRTRIERHGAATSFDAGRLNQETTLRVRAHFAAAVAAVPLSQWQSRRATWSEHAPLVAAAAAGLLVLGLVLTFGIYRDCAPRLTRGGSPMHTTAPPAQLQATLAGALRQGDVLLSQAVACFIDLAGRGAVQIDTVRQKRWWTGGEYTVRRLQSPRDLAAWERIVLDAALPSGTPGAIPMSRAWRGIHKSFGAFRTAVRDELRRRGELDPNAVHARRRVYACAAGSGVAALLAAALTPFFWGYAGPWMLLPSLALLVVAIVAMALAQQVSRLTALGQQRAEAWKSFGKHMQQLTKDHSPLDVRRFHAWFPYAVALGMGPAWLAAGRRWQLQVPEWFHVPAGEDGMAGLVAVFAASGASGGVGASGGASGGAGGGGSGAG